QVGAQSPLPDPDPDALPERQDGGGTYRTVGCVTGAVRLVAWWGGAGRGGGPRPAVRRGHHRKVRLAGAAGVEDLLQLSVGGGHGGGERRPLHQRLEHRRDDVELAVVGGGPVLSVERGGLAVEGGLGEARHARAAGVLAGGDLRRVRREEAGQRGEAGRVGRVVHDRDQVPRGRLVRAGLEDREVGPTGEDRRRVRPVLARNRE